MSAYSPNDQLFINRLTEIVEANLSNDQFGVRELADKSEMSRSGLYFRVKSITQKSVSQFIREIRLNKALELLKQAELNVSEISYKVGFGSPAYFNNCFHEQFGYPPGEARKHFIQESSSAKDSELSAQKRKQEKSKNKMKWIIAIVFLIILPGMYFLFIMNSSGNKVIDDPEKSIIVLPFSNLSSEKSNQYFADGIMEDILNQLTKVNNLKVVSRTSAEQFRETSIPSPEIARKMNINYLLEGSVRRQGEHVRISVQLIDARQDRHLWSKNYDRQLKDIFTIQRDISKNVADNLESILSPEEIKQIEKLHPKNAEAYDYYLMGRYLWDKRDSVSLMKSVRYFEKAIETEPDYVLAYAGLADAYYALSFRGYIDRSKGYSKAYELAYRTLEMDDSLPEAYAVLGIVDYFGYWKWEEARKLFEKALEIDSNCMVAHLYYSSFLDIVGEPDNALKHVNKAIELEPYFNLPYHMKGVYYRNNKKYAESTEAFRRSFELKPEGGQGSGIFFNFLELHDDASAIQSIKEIFFHNPLNQKYENRVIDVYDTSGICGVLKLYLEVTLKQEKPNPFSLATFYAYLGMQKETLDNLEKACREGLLDIPRMISKPEYENLHSNPRFLALVDTMNLTPYLSRFSE